MVKHVKHASILLGGILAISCSLNAFAANGPKIGLVDMQTIGQSASVKNATAALEKKFAPEQEKIKQKYEALQADVNKLKKDQSVMDKKSLKALQDKIQSEQNDIQNMQATLQQSVAGEQQQQMKAVMDQLKTVVAKVAKGKDLDIVLPAEAVLYAKNPINITSEVSDNLK